MSTKAEVTAWLKKFMDQPITLVKVRDQDGKEYETDAGKLMDLSPEKAQRLLADPELSKYVVFRA